MQQIRPSFCSVGGGTAADRWATLRALWARLMAFAEAPGASDPAASVLPPDQCAALPEGLVPGQMLEIVGPPGSGKTALALQLVVAVQRHWPTRSCAIVDLSATLWPPALRAAGACVERTLLVNLNLWEQVWAAAHTLVESGISLLVFDAVGALGAPPHHGPLGPFVAPAGLLRALGRHRCGWVCTAEAAAAPGRRPQRCAPIGAHAALSFCAARRRWLGPPLGGEAKIA